MKEKNNFIHINSNPIILFKKWYKESKESEINDPNAMNLATISQNLKPSSRIVLLKSFSDKGFVFYTNSNSKKGKALDIAGGEGRNSVFVASKGYDVTCLDISENGLRKAQALAQEKNTKINTLLADLDSSHLKENEYALVLCFNFLDRSLFSGIRKTLKPGGLLFYETFTLDYLKYSRFKKEWVLEANELLQEFSDFRILRYQEVDENSKGFASLVAQKL